MSNSNMSNNMTDIEKSLSSQLKILQSKYDKQIRLCSLVWDKCELCGVYTPEFETIHIPDNDGTLLEIQYVCDVCYAEGDLRYDNSDIIEEGIPPILRQSLS